MLVTDARGRSDNLFPSRVALKVLPLDYGIGVHSIDIPVPLDETYSMTFGSDDGAVTVEIVMGRGNVSPDEAIRYNDLLIGTGTARLQFTAGGVGPLQLDANNDGRFESILQPTAHVTGLAAKDTHRPRVEFEVLHRDATTIVIAIKAVDEGTGVKSVFYSFDGRSDIPYQAPIRIKLKEADLIYAIAEDRVGNQTIAVYEFRKRPGEQ
jgi:hypothetical protein